MIQADATLKMAVTAAAAALSFTLLHSAATVQGTAANIQPAENKIPVESTTQEQTKRTDFALAAANKGVISDPNLIYPDQVLRVG